MVRPASGGTTAGRVGGRSAARRARATGRAGRLLAGACEATRAHGAVSAASDAGTATRTGARVRSTVRDVSTEGAVVPWSLSAASAADSTSATASTGTAARTVRTGATTRRSAERPSANA
ncbi:hypothetical protein SHO565_69450 [Streptomyces sp. HO565]